MFGRLWQTDTELESPPVIHIGESMGTPARSADPMRGWIQLYDGDQAWPLDLERGSSITIENIAHALAMKVRFTGHCTEQYSIAQHSVHVCELVPDEDKPEGLMHDAAEFVLPDVASPIKAELPGFKALEHRTEQGIARRFNLRHPWPKSIKIADNGMVLFERSKIMNPPKRPEMVWTVPGEPAFIPNFEVWSWKKAEYEFLAMAYKLGIR